MARSRWPTDNPKTQMRIGDFWWTLRNTPAGDPLRYLRLWLWTGAEGRALAFAWFDPPAVGDFIVAPDAHGALLHEALDWIEGEHRRHGEGSLSIVVIAGDHERRRALEHRGYVRGDAGNVRFWRTLERPPDPAPRARL